MEIKRDDYLQQLIERKDDGMIKVITGIRRCGKSFLMFTIFKRYALALIILLKLHWTVLRTRNYEIPRCVLSISRMP